MAQKEGFGSGVPAGEIGYEDNFGHYDLDCEGERAFMENVMSRSTMVICCDCGTAVLLLPLRVRCSICAYNREMGWPISE